jgi:hypothetical protein
MLPRWKGGVFLLIERERIMRDATVWSCVLSAPMRELKLHNPKGADAIGTIPGLDKI